jgi:hypothetical protein
MEGEGGVLRSGKGNGEKSERKRKRNNVNAKKGGERQKWLVKVKISDIKLNSSLSGRGCGF